jgi:hypothetical protein
MVGCVCACGSGEAVFVWLGEGVRKGWWCWACVGARLGKGGKGALPPPGRAAGLHQGMACMALPWCVLLYVIQLLYHHSKHMFLTNQGLQLPGGSAGC